MTTQNQTVHRVLPVVSRSRVTPKEIFENVDAKQETEAPMDVYRAMVRTLLGSMSIVLFPNPSARPICVNVASMRRSTCSISVHDHLGEKPLLTHDDIRIQSSHHKPCRRLNLAYIRNPKNPPQKNVSHHVTPTSNGPLSGASMTVTSRLTQPCSLSVYIKEARAVRIHPRSYTECRSVPRRITMCRGERGT